MKRLKCKVFLANTACLKELNHKANEWLKQVNDKIHHGTHEKPVERLKKEGLVPLIKTYDLSRISYRKVGIDSHFSFRGNFYSVPPSYAGKEVTVKTLEPGHIVVYYRNEQIGLHELEEVFKGGYHTNPSHFLMLRELAKKQRLPKQRQKQIKPDADDLAYNQHTRASNFTAAQIIQLYPEVEQRDLKIYQEEY